MPGPLPAESRHDAERSRAPHLDPGSCYAISNMKKILGYSVAGAAVLGAVLIVRVPPAAAHKPRMMVIAHRGASIAAPENTLPAFEAGIKAGADWLEMDLWATRDNVLVVAHDAQLKPPVCTGPNAPAIIREITFEETRKWDCGGIRNPSSTRRKVGAGTRLPSFDEVLGLARGRKGFGFLIEVKSDPERPERQPEPAEYARMVIAALRRHKLETRAIVQSFDFRITAELKRQAQDIRSAALFSGAARDFSAVAKEAGGMDIVAPHLKLVTPAAVEEAHRAGLQVFSWTADTPAEWDALVAAGVDGIITNDPGGLADYLERKGLR